MKTFLFISFQHLVPQHFLSRLIGKLANSQTPWVKNTLIRLFIRRFNVDMSEANIENIENFKHFNDFFTRALKQGSRPIAHESTAFCSPADGAISQIGDIEKDQIFQAKGRHYSVKSLLASSDNDAQKYHQGQFTTIYLSPRDYHRVHMPIAATLTKMTYVPGQLFSVNQTTAENVDALFARNERLVCEFDTEQGAMAMVLVGALIVAGIETTWAGALTPFNGNAPQTVNYTEEDAPRFDKGQEMGRFYLGSTVILLTTQKSLEWLPQFSANHSVMMGEQMAHIKK